MHMTPCDVMHTYHTIVLDDACLCRVLNRVCMNACFETRIIPALFIVELIVFGWSKKTSLFNVISELNVK